MQQKKNKDLKNESIDFVLMHPPYADIIKYSDGISGDISQIHDIEKFCDEIEKIAIESFRVLKPGKFCAVLMGDTRRQKMYIPLAYKVMERFLKSGFTLKEDIVKLLDFGLKNQKRQTFYLSCMNIYLYFKKTKKSRLNAIF